MDAAPQLRGDPKPRSISKEVFILNPLHPDMQPVVPLQNLFDPQLPIRVKAAEGKVGKNFIRDLIKKGGPNPEGKDLRDVPPHEYPTMYEGPRQTLIELMLTAVDTVDSNTLQQAIQLRTQLGALDIEHADTETLKGAYEEHRKIQKALSAVKVRATNALGRFSAAFKLGSNYNYSLTRDSSLLYEVESDIHTEVLPQSGIFIRRDPNALLWTGLIAGFKEHYAVEWLQKDLDRIALSTITSDDLRNMRIPSIVHHRAVDYAKYDPLRGASFDNSIVSGEESFCGDFALLTQTALFTALSDGQIPTQAEVQAAGDLNLDSGLGDQVTRFLEQKFDLTINRDRQMYGRMVAGTREYIGGEIAQVLAHQAALVGLTKLTLSDFDPRYVDISKWVIVNREGKLAYLKDALDETIAKAKNQSGKEQFVRLAETCKHMMNKLHLAVEQATGEQGGTQQGLVMTRDNLFQPLKLDGGGEWRTKTPAEAHTIREMWLAEGESKLDDPVQAGGFLNDVYGIKVNTDPSQGPVTTEKDFMLMVRKTIAAQLPIYAGPDAFFLNKDFGEILAKEKEIVHASRTVARHWKLNSQPQ